MNSNLATTPRPDRSEVRAEIKRLIVEALRLEELQPEQITDDALLFSAEGGGLGLDSLNALEILTAIEFHFKVRFGGGDSIKPHFRSVATLADFVVSADPQTPR